MLAPHPFTDRIKARPDVEVIEIGPHNRNRLPADLANKLMELSKLSQGE
jgi:nucleoside-triphosphatase THEP1